MFTNFFYFLRSQGIAVSFNEWMTLLEALDKGLGCGLTDFYYLCRAILLKSEGDFDRFDLAFSQYFSGVETPEDLPGQIWEWLDKHLPQEELPPNLNAVRQHDLEELKKMLAQRLAEQKEEHHGGNYWVGTGGTSPFGHSGYAPGGIRIGGESRRKSAVKVAAERRFIDFRSDKTLEIRQFQMALRKLRQFSGRLEGPKTELNLTETIKETGRNGGRLKLVYERPRKNTMKILLLMDSGGSMSRYSSLCNQLFQAVHQSAHFKDLKTYYFHNCVYDWLYEDPTCSYERRIDTEFVMRSLDSDYRLFIVGDASMAHSELMRPGGVIDWYLHNEQPGIFWLGRLAQNYPYHVWLNPIRKEYWPFVEGAWTIGKIKEIFPMYELTLEGLEEGIKRLRAIR